MLRTFVLSTYFSLFLYFFILSQTNPNHVWVEGYTRSNGTHVSGYWRTAPNNTNVDNFSTRGNTNPYTGQSGWVTPDGGNNPWSTEEIIRKIVKVNRYKRSRNSSLQRSSYSTSTNNTKAPITTYSTTSNSNGSTSSYVVSTTGHSNNNSSHKNISANGRSNTNDYLNQTWYSKGDQVNVRYNSNLKSKIAYRIDHGDEVKVLSKSTKKANVKGLGEDYWYEIEMNGISGWVFGKLIGTLEYDQQSPDQWDGEFMYVNGSSVNCRSEPSIQIGKVLFQLKKNDRIELVAKTNSKFRVKGYEDDYWYYIRRNGKQGWVFGKLLGSIN